MSETTVKEVKRIANLSEKLRWGLGLHWLCYGALIALYSWLNLQHEYGAWGVWLFQVIPLTLPLWSMLKGNHKAYSWFCFIILFYFTAAVVSVGMPAEHVKALPLDATVPEHHLVFDRNDVQPLDTISAILDCPRQSK